VQVIKGFLNGLGCLVIKSQLAFFIALKVRKKVPKKSHCENGLQHTTTAQNLKCRVFWH